MKEGGIFSREPRLYKRVCPSVGPSVGPSVMLLSAGRDEPANDLFRVYKLVLILLGLLLRGSTVSKDVR